MNAPNEKKRAFQQRRFWIGLILSFVAIETSNAIGAELPPSGFDCVPTNSGVYSDNIYIDCLNRSATVDDREFFGLEPYRNSSANEDAKIDYNGNSFSFSKETIVRGSLSLPSLKKFQIWGNVYLGGGHITPKDQSRVESDLTGVMIGLTLSSGSYGKISGYYNYNNSEMDFSHSGNEAKTNLAGLSYMMDVGSAYFTVLGTYGSDSYSLEKGGRSLDYEGYQATGYAESGLVMETNGLFALNPFGALQYSYLEHDSFDRSTVSLIDGSKTNYDAFYSTMGSRITVNLAGMDALTLQGRMAWIHQMRSQNEAIQNINFGRIPGSLTPTQVFYEGNAGRDYFWGGIGLRLGMLSRIAFSLDYDVLLNKYQTTHLGSAGLLIGF